MKPYQQLLKGIHYMCWTILAIPVFIFFMLVGLTVGAWIFGLKEAWHRVWDVPYDDCPWGDKKWK